MGGWRCRSAGWCAGAVALLGAVVGGVPAGAADDELTGAQWGLDVTATRAAHAAGFLGDGIDVAVLDSGLHVGHRDFAGRVGAGIDLVDPGTPPQDEHGHGTHVAGIVAAGLGNGGTIGVAPRARIMPVRVLDAAGNGSSANVEAGIRWAVDNGAEVINLSLSSDTQFVFGPSTEAAIRYAWDRGVVCVFAAGNDFVLSSGFADEPALVVSATSREDRESYFSNGVGQAQWGIAAPGGARLPFSAVEDDILSTTWVADDQTATYAYNAGTSMAAPFVSGAAALLRAAGLDAAATVDVLLATADDLGAPGRDGTFGAGRLDVAAAVARATGAPPPPPAPLPPPDTGAAPEAGGDAGSVAPPRREPAPGGGLPSPVPVAVTTAPLTSASPTDDVTVPELGAAAPLQTRLGAPADTTSSKAPAATAAALLVAGVAAGLVAASRRAPRRRRQWRSP